MESENKQNGGLKSILTGISFASFIIVLAYIIGIVVQKFFIPDMSNKSVLSVRFLIGCGCLVLYEIVRSCVMMICRAFHNRKTRKLDSVMVMQTYNEFAKAGVRTPLDFCYLMLTTSFETPINILSGGPDRLRQLDDMDLYVKTVNVFKDMFGRNPMKADSYDWLYVTICEMFTQMNKIAPNMTFQNLQELVSPQVLDYETRFTQEWSYEIQRQFTRQCKKIAAELQKAKNSAAV